MRYQYSIPPIALLLFSGAAYAQSDPAAEVKADADQLFQELDDMSGNRDKSPVAANEAAPPKEDERAPAPAEPPPAAELAPAVEEKPAQAEEPARAEPERSTADHKALEKAERKKVREQRRAERREEQRLRRAARSEEPPCPGNRAVCRRVGLGFEGQAAAAAFRQDTLEVMGLFGWRASVTVAPFLTLGVSELGGCEARLLDGHRWAVQAAPYVELFWFSSRALQLYADVGVTLQRRFGGGMAASTGVAPFAATGLRLWMGNRFTVAPEVRVHQVTSAGLAMWRRVLPEGSTVVTAALSTELHF